MEKAEVFELRLVKASAAQMLHALARTGFVLLPDVIQCSLCKRRYLLLADLSSRDGARAAALDLEAAIRMLLARVADEHLSGHCRDDLVVAISGGNPGNQLHVEWRLCR